MTLKELYEDPFKWVDRFEGLRFGRVNFNFFQWKWANTILIIALISLGAWIVMGFDSTVAQPLHFLYHTPQYLFGNITMSEWIDTFFAQYGRELHWSAMVIYGFCFYGLSKNFSKSGITGSRNLAYSLGLTILSIGIFEFYWMGSYALFQGQPWVLTFRFPQLRIIMQNIVFVVIGGVIALQMFVDSHEFKGGKVLKTRLWKFNWSKTSWLLIFLSVCFAVQWWFYPLPVERFSVEMADGSTWTNSNMFPQTLYTIDVDVSDTVNAGEWWWKQNDLVHALNTWVKVLFTLVIFNIGRVQLTKNGKEKPKT